MLKIPEGVKRKTEERHTIMNNITIIETLDGSLTLYNSKVRDHYHSINGALNESRHIFINGGLLSIPLKDIDLLEIGFGTGLNALLSALEADKRLLNIKYTAIEKYPLDPGVTSKLKYGRLISEEAEVIEQEIHDAPWNIPVAVTERFTIKKIEADLVDWSTDAFFDIIYFDAFAPDMQPEMWSDDIIKKIAATVKTGGLFVTYSARGALKRELQSAGFRVDHPPGPTGKREFTRAQKQD